MMELEAMDGKILQAFNHIMIHIKKVAQAYNKRVRERVLKKGSSSRR